MRFAPSIKIRKSGIKIAFPVLTTLTVVTYCLFYANVINLSNYSFLMYSFSGGSVSNPLFEVIKYSRLPVLLLGFLAINLHRPIRQKIYAFFVQNLDVTVFALFIWLGLMNSVDLVNGVLYTLWQTLALLGTLAFFFLLKLRLGKDEGLFTFFQFLFWSNFLVYPLLVINLHTFGNDWVYNMAFSSKTFYPYCLLSMVVAIYSSHLFVERSLFNSLGKRKAKLLEWVLVISIILFCFFSARRAPLFLILVLSSIYGYIAVGKQWWKRGAIILMLLAGIAYSIPKANAYIQEHRHELAILKKLGDLQESTEGVSGDGSYKGRLILWELYWSIINEYPLTGVGSYNSSLMLEKKYPYHPLTGYSTHNLYMGILVEHGFIGLFLFLVILLRSIVLIFQRAPFPHFCYYGIFLLVPILAINWNEYNLIPGQVFYWTTILVVLFPRFYLSK